MLINVMFMFKLECMFLWMVNLLSVSFEDNELCVIFVLIDVNLSGILDFICWVMYISVEEDGY